MSDDTKLFSTVEQMLEHKYGVPKEGMVDALTIIKWAASPSVMVGIISADTYAYNIIPRAQRLATNMGVKSYDELVLPELYREGKFNSDFDLPFESGEWAEKFSWAREDIEKVMARHTER